MRLCNIAAIEFPCDDWLECQVSVKRIPAAVDLASLRFPSRTIDFHRGFDKNHEAGLDSGGDDQRAEFL